MEVEITRTSKVAGFLFENGMTHAMNNTTEAFALLPQSAIDAMSDEKLAGYVKKFAETINKYYYMGMA